mmetsp:Transcript_107692/g.213998  ORF Transcript_107692/g.213998 Transcript_107692/m.213998 type:complete len:87 (+) Transcript_107692:40-300(+)|eukprot:CAMPEP_0172714066 /NCGR_PEP_ID=MMETSP1074-20121228/64637_1 /TAXON_ID=2916 /ORGANISM="Ceratium fusus, Strain PA161109" /LENGTH=86 /DNA_ID=CAMNT_0013538377 /DNA_START=40 /DNA_END=300 /DNA_ORIENTATION=-
MALFSRKIAFVLAALFAATAWAGGGNVGYNAKKGSSSGSDCTSKDDDDAFSIGAPKKLIQRRGREAPEEQGLGRQPAPVLDVEEDA